MRVSSDVFCLSGEGKLRRRNAELFSTSLLAGGDGHIWLYILGDEIDVVMLEIDLEKSRIWLSYKQTKPDPWELVPAKYKVGSVVRGKIVKIISYGAFAELEEGIEGLIHISRIAPKPFVVEKVVTLGKEYNLKVVALDVKTRRISLSLMEVPEEQSSTVVDIGTVYNDSQATEEENPEDGD